jgi:hypothetical protein
VSALVAGDEAAKLAAKRQLGAFLDRDHHHLFAGKPFDPHLSAALLAFDLLAIEIFVFCFGRGHIVPREEMIAIFFQE